MKYIEYPNVFVSECKDCHGYGEYIDVTCDVCNGKGFIYTQLGEQLIAVLNELKIL